VISYYIYYRVPPANAAKLQTAVGQVLAEVLQSTGVAGRLMRRRDDRETWMEVYEDVADGAAFEHALANALEAHGVVALLESTRVIERFIRADAPGA